MDAQLVSRIWWAHHTPCVASWPPCLLLFRVVALFSTGATLLALVDVFGVFAVLNGLFALAAVRVRAAHQRWGWLVVAGLVGVVAGTVSFLRASPRGR